MNNVCVWCDNDDLCRPAVEEVSAVPQRQGTKLNRDA